MNIALYNNFCAQGLRLLLLVSSLAYSSIPKMETICPCETSGSLWTIRRYNGKDRTFSSYCRKNLKSGKIFGGFHGNLNLRFCKKVANILLQLTRDISKSFSMDYEPLWRINVWCRRVSSLKSMGSVKYLHQTQSKNNVYTLICN
jgi:hypothetical protein